MLPETCHPCVGPLSQDCQDPGQAVVLFAAQQRLDKPWQVALSSGRWGDWTEAQICSSNKLVSFSLRVERWHYLRDNTAVNNVRFACSNGTQLEGWGPSGGHYGPWSSNCTSGAICGLQTKVEEPQGKWDDTALNDMRVFCCH